MPILNILRLQPTYSLDVILQYFYSLIYGSSCGKGRFMKTVGFNIICNITQEPKTKNKKHRNKIVPMGSSWSLLG